METKVCTKCLIEKPLDEMVKRSNASGGYRPLCKSCYNQYKKGKYKQDSTKIKETLKRYKEKNPNYLKEYREENREKLLQQMKSYYQKNSKKLKEDMKNYQRDRKKTDILFNIQNRMRCRLYHFLDKKDITKKSKTFEIIGCSPEFLKEYLEKQFKGGMSWDNRNEWHIDHIIPLSSSKTEEEIYQLSHYTNLQPLWAEDNLKKGNKILKTI
jgi:hypothetical protein